MMNIFDEAMIEAEEWCYEIRNSGQDSEIIIVREGFDFEICFLEALIMPILPSKPQ